MGWYFWVLVVLLITFFNKFIPWVKRGTMGKESRALLDIAEWQEKHLVRKTQSKKRIWCYQSDTGNVFKLGDRESEFKKITDWAERLVKVFEERRQSRRQLDKELRRDPLLDQIEESFLSAMVQYLSEVNMFQYDRIADKAYTDTTFSHIQTLLAHAEGLTRHYGDYMLALMQSAAADTESEREVIANAVQSMTLAVAQAREDIPIPAELTEPGDQNDPGTPAQMQ